MGMMAQTGISLWEQNSNTEWIFPPSVPTDQSTTLPADTICTLTSSLTPICPLFTQQPQQQQQQQHTSIRQNFRQINTSPSQNPRHFNNNHDPQVNVTFSPESYTPHSNLGNSPHFQRSPPERGRTNGRNGRGY